MCIRDRFKSITKLVILITFFTQLTQIEVIHSDKDIQMFDQPIKLEKNHPPIKIMIIPPNG